MRKSNLSLLIVILLTAILSSSCEKEDPTKEELLTNGIWNGLKIEEYHDNVLRGSGDYQATFDFKDNHEASLTFEGSTYQLSWEFNADQTELILDGIDFEIIPYTIITLTDTSLTIKETTTIDDIVYEDVYFYER